MLPPVEVRHHLRQEAQDAPRPLEGRVGAPALKEDVYQFRMEGVGPAQFLPVGRFPHLPRDVVAQARVEFPVRIGDAGHFVRVRVALKEAAANDLVDLLPLHRRVDGLQAAEDALQPGQRPLPLLAVRRAGGQRHHQGGARQDLHRLGQFLHEGQHLGLVRPRRLRLEARLAQFPHVHAPGHVLGDFVHQDQDRPVAEEFVETVLARGDALLVVLPQGVVGPQLGGDLAPQGAALQRVGGGAHKDRDPEFGVRSSEFGVAGPESRIPNSVPGPGCGRRGRGR